LFPHVEQSIIIRVHHLSGFSATNASKHFEQQFWLPMG
jgi:hypothetical protein